jgi:hypothetical protein
VALFTENPPHNHLTKIAPLKGIVEKRLVITVAPQKDICPQGKTYPKKAIAISINIRRVPVNQTKCNRKDLKYNPRPI